jgi:tetratricopeptide (TPR) repeat protein
MKNTFLATCLMVPLLSSCGLDKEMAKIEHKAILINKYENVALMLARENRELHAEVKRLEFDIQKLKQEHGFKTANTTEDHGATHSVGHAPEPTVAHNESHGEAHNETHSRTHGDAHAETNTHATQGRSIASIKPLPLELKTDLVEYKTYKWSADDMVKIADKEFKAKNFEKAAQFYTSLLNYYPDFKHLDDEFYFKAGISSYESGTHHDWTIKHFSVLMAKWPTSQYYRSAKLWVALTHMKMGEKQKFFATVEEFRKKYRNTNEWKILSSYYEKIEEKTHE